MNRQSGRAKINEALGEREDQFDKQSEKLRAEFRRLRRWISWMGFGFVLCYFALQLVTTPEQTMALLAAWLCWIGLLIAATPMD